jgi:DNA-binding GntR family transcriptional regulator
VSQGRPPAAPADNDAGTLRSERSGTLVNDVVDALRGRIVRGELRPGAKLRQQECAEILGVSRTPLREAFQRLEADGWVQLRARQGAEVKGMTVIEAEEIFTLRVLLETFASRLSAIAHSAEDEPRAGVLIEQASTQSADATSAQWEDANQRFHELIYGLKDDQIPAELAATVRRHWTRALRYRSLYWSGPGATRSSELSHRSIFEAWSRRDPAATEQAVAEHILTALRDIIARIDPARCTSPALAQLAARYGVAHTLVGAQPA